MISFLLRKRVEHMSADDRKVATDALETLGKILVYGTEKRDAIHLAVEPVVAIEWLLPGQHVGFVDGGVGRCKDPVGIVDPFLKDPVQRGEAFWLVVYPREITSLRHVWEHPKFPAEKKEDSVSTTNNNLIRPKRKASKQIEESIDWIKTEAESLGVSYDDLIKNAIIYVDHGEYWNEGQLFEGQYISEEFWVHFAVVTGKVGPGGNFLSCAC
jgi:hypothetical protein